MTSYRIDSNDDRRQFLKVLGAQRSRCADSQRRRRVRRGTAKQVKIVRVRSGGQPDRRRRGRKDRKAARRMEEAVDARAVRGHAPGRHRSSRHRQVREQPRRRPVSLHLLQHGAVRFQDQVRIRHRLAQLLAADREGKCRSSRMTTRTECSATKCCAPAATLIWGTSLTTARRPRICAIA